MADRILVVHEHTNGRYKETEHSTLVKAKEVFKTHKKNEEIISSEIYLNGNVIDGFDRRA